MKKAIITLIALAQTNLSFTLHLEFPIPEILNEVDAKAYNQPALRLFVAKDSKTSGISVSYHKEKIETSFESFINRTNSFLESKFPFTVQFLSKSKNSNDAEIHLYLLKSTQKDLNLQILQAYFIEKDEVFLLSYSGPKGLFEDNLTSFKNLVQNAKISSNPSFFIKNSNSINEKLLTGLKEMIATKGIPYENFPTSNDIISFFSKELPNNNEKIPFFELRSFLYD